MSDSKSGWSKTLLWGGVTGVCYVILFEYAEALIELAHTTVDTCAATAGDKTVYFRKPEAAQCVAKGGEMIEGNPWHVLVPIAIAFILSYVHGAFTGHFWETLGLTAAKKK